MRRILPILLGLLLATPLALAEEDRADCEEDQPWLAGERSIVHPAFEAARGAVPLALSMCEGEQWDGQDPLRDEPTSCSGAVHVDDSLLGYCMAADPNAAPTEDALHPVGVRLSREGTQEAYASANVAFVSRVAVYAGTCDAGGPGLEGDAACGGNGEARTGIYWRDNTPGNLLIRMTRQCLTSLTGCGLSENDCSHAAYREDQRSGRRSCDRDNTALGLGLVLP